MPVFEVLLHGRGIKLVDPDGVSREGGVYVLCPVKAADEHAAVVLAREAIWEHTSFTDEVRNDSTEEIVFTAEEVNRRAFWQRGRRSAPVFYIEDEDIEGSA